MNYSNNNEIRPKRVVNKTDKKNKEKNKRKSSATNVFYYSFFTIILFLCLIQITKIVSYNAKIVQITKTRNAAQALNAQLKDNIHNFSNASGLEAIARNNLKMSSEDEVLVIINKPLKEEKDEKSKKWDFIGL